MSESKSVGGKSIDVRSLCDFITIAAQGRTFVISDEEDYVLFGGTSQGGRDGQTDSRHCY